MTGRLASRAADTEALLARFNGASEAALAALGRGDRDALVKALDVREELQHEIERAIREITVTRSRFAPNVKSTGASRIADRAVQQYCEPLEELARVAQELQQRLEMSASQIRDRLLGEIATLETATGVVARYTPASSVDPHRLDVVL
jgi:hypothetical protein